MPMEEVRSIAESTGWDREAIVIAGTRMLAFSRSLKTAAGVPADEYVPYCASLALTWNGSKVEIDPSTVAFVQLEAAIRHHRLPLDVTLVEQGADAPQESEDFAISYAIVDDLSIIDDEWLQAIVTDDQERLDEVAWQRFRYSDAFFRRPCSRETYDLLLAGLDEGPEHLRMMPIDQYYDWYADSSLMIGDDGRLAPDAEAQAGSMIEAWLSLPTPLDADAIKYWLCTNLCVHPLHRQAFEELVDEKTPAVAPVSPS
jgi:hypothetical protein